MTILNRDYRYLFIHVPKAAGKSVKQHLLDNTFSPGARALYRISAGAQSLRSYAARNATVDRHLPLFFGPGVSPEIRNYCRAQNQRTSAHLTASEMRAALGNGEFAGLFSFAFTRNPWDRCLSAYYYFRRKRFHPMHAVAAKCTFESFLLELEKQEAAFVGNQARWLFDEQEVKLVSFIGKIEQLAVHMEFIEQTLGIPSTGFSTRVNVSAQRDRDYRHYYSSDAIDTVARMMEADVRLLGYQFG